MEICVKHQSWLDDIIFKLELKDKIPLSMSSSLENPSTKFGKFEPRGETELPLESALLDVVEIVDSSLLEEDTPLSKSALPGTCSRKTFFNGNRSSSSESVSEKNSFHITLLRLFRYFLHV